MNGHRHPLCGRTLVVGLCIATFLPAQWGMAKKLHIVDYEPSPSAAELEREREREWNEIKAVAFIVGGAIAVAGAVVAVAGASAVASTPFTVPYAAIEDDGGDGYFQKYPYEEGGGFMRLEGDQSYEPWPYSLQWSTEFGSDFDSVSRIGTNLHLETTWRLGFDTELNWFDDHDHHGAFAEDFWQGDFNSTYRFAQSHHAQWWTGLGVNWIDGAGADTDYGFNFTYGADIFIGEPFVLSGSLDYGLDEDFFHGRLAVGANWKLAEAFVGYDYLNVGPREHDTVMIGLRTWW